ncbi:uncharacterized protein LOC111133879 [Crassostrea virginica]
MKMRMVICFIRVILSLLYFSLLSMSNNFCSDDICCSGYYLYEENGNKTCLECVGAFGNNCSTHCGPGSYGEQCKFKCQCPENQCDRVNGCMKDKKGVGENITAIDERAPDTLDFLKNISIFHWVIDTACRGVATGSPRNSTVIFGTPYFWFNCSESSSLENLISLQDMHMVHLQILKE